MDLRTQSYRMTIFANIRLGWKGLPEKNALAYYEQSSNTSVKSLMTLVPGVQCVFRGQVKIINAMQKRTSKLYV